MFKNLKAGIGFITINDIFDRLKFFSPPDEEHYFVERISGRNYVSVGLEYYGGKKKLFHVYAGTKELYNLICEMTQKAAEMMNRELIIEEWNDTI